MTNRRRSSRSDHPPQPEPMPVPMPTSEASFGLAGFGPRDDSGGRPKHEAVIGAQSGHFAPSHRRTSPLPSRLSTGNHVPASLEPVRSARCRQLRQGSRNATQSPRSRGAEVAEIIAADELPQRTQTAGDPRIRKTDQLVDHQQLVSRAEQANEIVLGICKSLGKLAESHHRQAKAGRLVAAQKPLRRTAIPLRSLPLEIDQKGSVEAHSVCHGSGGGVSARWADSSRCKVTASITGASADRAKNAAAVNSRRGQRARRITFENDSVGSRRARQSLSYASRSTDMVFVAMHARIRTSGGLGKPPDPANPNNALRTPSRIPNEPNTDSCGG